MVTVARIYIPFLAAIPLRYDVTEADRPTDRATHISPPNLVSLQG